MRSKISFYVEDSVNARFKIQRKFDHILQTKFFTMIVDSYLEQDPLFMTYFYNKTLPLKNKSHAKKLKKEAEKSKKNLENFGLTDQEVENIFDVIASEDPDL